MKSGPNWVKGVKNIPSDRLQGNLSPVVSTYAFRYPAGCTPVKCLAPLGTIVVFEEKGPDGWKGWRRGKVIGHHVAVGSKDPARSIPFANVDVLIVQPEGGTIDDPVGVTIGRHECYYMSPAAEAMAASTDRDPQATPEARAKARAEAKAHAKAKAYAKANADAEAKAADVVDVDSD
jgi:hypothetical protein